MPVSKITNENRHQLVTRKRNKSQSFNKETDTVLYKIAALEPYKNLKKVANNSLIATTILAPIADSYASGIATQGPLSKKMAVAYKTLGRWAVVFGVLGSVFAIKKAINKKSEKLDNFDKNYKLSSFAIDLTAMYAGLNLTLALFDKASKKIKEKFPKAVENFKTRTLQPLENVMDRSKINKVLVKKLDKTINKNIYNKTAINTSLKLVTPVIMFSGFFRYIAEAVRANKEVQENYTVLKTLTNEKFLFEHK